MSIDGRTRGAPDDADKIRNYTPHAMLVWRPEAGQPVTLVQRGNARCDEEYVQGGLLPGTDLPLTLMRYGAAEGLPDPVPGVVYLVSQLVVNACLDRRDLVFPAGLVRDSEGTIIGFRHLARPAPHADQPNIPEESRWLS